MTQRAVGAALVLMSIAAAGMYVALGLLHLRCPAELDYIEGVMMDHVVRVMTGRPLYVAPSLEFVTLAYMPLYTAACAALSALLGPDFWVARGISFLSSLGIAALAGWIVRRETGSRVLPAAASGIFLMGYGIGGGGHYDIVRPDSMMLLLALSGLAVLRFTTGTAGALAAAALLVAAFFTKQHAVWFGIAGLLHVAVNDRRRLLAYGLPLVAGCAGGYALLAAWLGPWFSFYTFDMPAHWSRLDPIKIRRYLGEGLIGTLGPLTAPVVLSLALPRAPWRGPEGIWMWAGVGAMGTGLLATFDPSAWRHVFLPTMVFLSVLGPVSLGRLADDWSARPGANRSRVFAAAYLLLLWQFLPLVYSLKNEVPDPTAGAARARFEAELAAMPGPVIVLEHGFYAWRAGKGASLQIIAVGDIERAPGNRLEREDPRALERMVEPLLAGPGRPRIVTDEPMEACGPLWAKVAGAYRLERDLGDMTEPLTPLSGHRLPPRYVYAPAEAAADTAGAAP